jgi:pyruvate kinase
MVSKYRPPVRIIASTPHVRVQRQMKLLWGTESLKIRHCDNMDELLQLTVKQLHTSGVVKPEERIVVVRASALVPGKTNVLEVFTVDDVLKAKIHA